MSIFRWKLRPAMRPGQRACVHVRRAGGPEWVSACGHSLNMPNGERRLTPDDARAWAQSLGAKLCSTCVKRIGDASAPVPPITRDTLPDEQCRKHGCRHFVDGARATCRVLRGCRWPCFVYRLIEEHEDVCAT